MKTRVLESLFNKVTGLGHVALLKRRLWHRHFPVNFVKFLRTPFFTEQLRTTASVVFRFSNNGHTYPIYFKKNCFVRRILRLCILVILSEFCVQKISYMKVKVESAGNLLLLCKHDVVKPFCMCANWENIMVNKCCVVWCRLNYKGEETIPMFSFPSDENIKNWWIKFVNRKDWQPTSSAVICIKRLERWTRKKV